MTGTDVATRVKDVDAAQQAGAAVQKAGETIFDKVRVRKDRYTATLNKLISPELFVQTALTTISKTPGLAACTDDSILGSLMISAQLSLAPGGPLGHAYLVPFKRQCTFIIGYKGKIALAMRSGEIASVKATPVYEGDEFRWSLGLREDLVHEPTSTVRDDPAKLTHVYAIARFRDRDIDPVFVVLTRAEVDTYRERSKAKNDGPWVTDYVPMSLKTAVHRLGTWLPMAIDLARSSGVDERVFETEQVSVDDYIDVDGEEVKASGAPAVAGPATESDKSPTSSGATPDEHSGSTGGTDVAGPATFDCEICQGSGQDPEHANTICAACNGTGAAS